MSLNRTLSEMKAALMDITLERTETLPQVPSIDLEELFPGWQSTSIKDHSPRQWTEIFRNASFGSSIIPNHTTTSSTHEGSGMTRDANMLEMLHMEEAYNPNNMDTVPVDELFLHGKDQPQLMDDENPQHVPRMSVERKKRIRSIFDDRIVLSRAEMFLTAEEIERADLSNGKKPKQLKEDQILSLINAPLLQCKALQYNCTGSLLAELMPNAMTMERGSPPLDCTPFKHETIYEEVEMVRAPSDSTSNIHSFPWSNLDSLSGSDVRRQHGSIPTTSE